MPHAAAGLGYNTYEYTKGQGVVVLPKKFQRALNDPNVSHECLN